MNGKVLEIKKNYTKKKDFQDLLTCLYTEEINLYLHPISNERNQQLFRLSELIEMIQYFVENLKE